MLAPLTRAECAWLSSVSSGGFRAGKERGIRATTAVHGISPTGEGGGVNSGTWMCIWMCSTSVPELICLIVLMANQHADCRLHHNRITGWQIRVGPLLFFFVQVFYPQCRTQISIPLRIRTEGKGACERMVGCVPSRRWCAWYQLCRECSFIPVCPSLICIYLPPPMSN